jgi:hypothetical protein
MGNRRALVSVLPPPGLLSAILASCALIAGCSSGPSRATTADLARAHTLVAQAQASGAQQYAGADLQAARDNVQQADQLAKRDSRRAGWLANEAAANAQLASARTQSARVQQALEDSNRILQTLREETERNASGAGAPPATEQSVPSPTNPRD